MRKISIIDKITRLCLAFVSPILLLSVFVACEDVNSTHQKYLDQGEKIYTGAVFELKAVAGFKRATFEWKINADPRITKTVIYWGANREYSLEVPVNRTTSGTMLFSQEMTNMGEGDYMFVFITEDNDGHYSMPQEIAASIYGDDYKAILVARDIKSIVWKSNGDAVVTWYGIYSNTTQYSTIEYTDNTGELISVKVENNQTQTTLSNLMPLSDLYVSTTYLPKDGLDTVASPSKKYEVPNK